jgi:RecB family exonuclease
MPAQKKSASRPKTERKPTLSPTRIAAYLECAVKYRYIYIDKVGRFYMRARSHYSFGSTLHHVLQTFHEQGATHSVEEMTETLEQNWIKAGYESTEQEEAHRAAGTHIVQVYHTAHQERIEAQVETIATEKTITCDMGAFKLSGRIDRLDRHQDGRLEVIDYKSGHREWTEEHIANDLAMNCYQLILSHLYPDTPISATIFNLRYGTSATATQTLEDRTRFEADLRELGAEILSRDFSAILPERLPICPECDFLPLCERFWRASGSLDTLDTPFHDD